MSEKEVSKKNLSQANTSEEQSLKHFLLSGEFIAYHSQDTFFTNKRIIKYKTNTWSKLSHLFYSSFEDLDLRHLEGIKAKNIINTRLLFFAVVILLLGPIAGLLSLIPGLHEFSNTLLTYVVSDLGLGGLFIISIVLIISAIILRDRVIEFYGHNSIIRSKHFTDRELLKIRELHALASKKS